MAAILCVSERPEDARALVSTLRADGHEVIEAADRFRAIEQLVGREFAAAIVFLGTSTEVRELVPLMTRLDRRLPILTVAQEDSVETQREIRRWRVFFHLTQPVDPTELRQALGEALARRVAG